LVFSFPPEHFQVLNVSDFNIASPFVPVVLGFLRHVPVSRPAQASAGKKGQPDCLQAANAGFAQNFSLGNAVFNHLIHSSSTPRNHWRRDRHCSVKIKIGSIDGACQISHEFLGPQIRLRCPAFLHLERAATLTRAATKSTDVIAVQTFVSPDAWGYVGGGGFGSTGPLTSRQIAKISDRSFVVRQTEKMH
jgi:hypothetical protein